MTSTEIVRVDPPFTGGERETLNGFLDYLRDTVRIKCTGLSNEDARRSLLPSELTTVAGLLAHLRWVEAYWFEVVLDGAPDRAPYSKEDPDGEFRSASEIPIEVLLHDYQQQCAISREIAAKLALDEKKPFRGGSVGLRWVLVHMIEETGRHAGHLDILREMLDGEVGE
jgi:hypothetical protein